MGKCTERLYNGIVKENPTFVQMLGMCPTLAVTSSAINGAGMGLTTTCILVLSNFMISALRKVIPDKVRIPSFIVIIASFVTIIQFLLQAYLPSLNDSLGLYIPLIVVNCIILGRAEAYASKNKVLPSVFDGLGMGLGFTVGLTLIGMFRELLGKGCIFGFQILGDGNQLQSSSGIVKAIGNVFSLYTPITILVLAPGAFFVLAFLIAFINKRNAKKAAEALAHGEEIPEVCRPDSCAGCINAACCGKLTADTAAQAASKPVSVTEKAAVPKTVSTAEKAEATKPVGAVEKAEATKPVGAAEKAEATKPVSAAEQAEVPNQVISAEKTAAPASENKTEDDKIESSSVNAEKNTVKPAEGKDTAAVAPEEVKAGDKTIKAADETNKNLDEKTDDKDSDIKLKETMAHIKTKKGKGGKR
jgi:RnfABCDGE-type electron transport complex E subunit